MTDSEQIRQNVQSRAPFSTWLGVVLLFALFGAIALAVIGPSPRGTDYEQSRSKKRIDTLKTLRDADQKTLTGYGWVDKNKGVAHIPIDRALELTVTDLQKKKPSAAYPIATPEAQTSAAGTASPSPAPTASSKPGGTPKAVSVEGQKSESRGQPAAAVNPPKAQPSSQPGASATPAALPQPSAAVPAVSPSPTRSPTPPGSPLPVPGTTP
jgi:hypothetical protein